jgi:hypothetical protein
MEQSQQNTVQQNAVNKKTKTIIKSGHLIPEVALLFQKQEEAMNISSIHFSESFFKPAHLKTPRFKAFGIHLLISLIVSLSFIVFAINYWFPDQLLQLTGISDVFFILIGVDIIIGPILTLIVYNIKKKRLWLDLSFIALLQIGAFIYGAYAFYQAHPVYITFNVDRFTLVSARDASPEKAQYPEYHISKLSKPMLAYAESPTDTEERNELMMSVLFSGALDLNARPEYYKPYTENIEKIISRSWVANQLFVSASDQQRLMPFLTEKSIDELAFLPIEGKAAFMLYVLDKETAKPLGIIGIDPWDQLKKNDINEN